MLDGREGSTHCAVCQKKTVKVWRNGKAYCSSCGRSCIEMAAEGLDTAGPWQDCPNCQNRNYYEKHGDKLCCESCGLTVEEATAIDSARPMRISYRPDHVTAGSIMELQYSLHGTELPVLLHVYWGVNGGTTSLCLRKEDFPPDAAIARWTIDVPSGVTSAKVIDRSERSRSLEVPIVLRAVFNRRTGWIRRLLGI